MVLNPSTRCVATPGLRALALLLALLVACGGRDAIDVSSIESCDELADAAADLLENIATENQGLTETDFSAGEAEDQLVAYTEDADLIEARRVEIGCGDDFMIGQCSRLTALEDMGVVGLLLAESHPECL